MLSHVIQLKLFLHPLLIVDITALILTAPEIYRNVVPHIYNLCLVFHVVSEALTSGSHQVKLVVWTIRSEIGNMIAEALSLGCLALAFKYLQIQTILLISSRIRSVLSSCID